MNNPQNYPHLPPCSWTEMNGDKYSVMGYMHMNNVMCMCTHECVGMVGNNRTCGEKGKLV